jgi:hypothetical protein
MCYWRGEVQMHRGIYITNLNLLIISHFTFNHTPLVSGNTITINTPGGGEEIFINEWQGRKMWGKSRSFKRTYLLRIPRTACLLLT